MGSAQQALCGNVAIGAAVSAQSTFPGYSTDHVNDGDRSTVVGEDTSWVNAHTYGPDGRLPQWLDLDFGAPRSITRVDLYTSQGYELKDYDVQVWGGASWSTVASVRGSHDVMVTSTFPAVTTNKLRILSLLGPDDQYVYARINELEVIGCSQTSIKGQIVDLNGSPLAGITVEVGGKTVTTDQSGRYAVLDLPYGTYTIHPSGGGYTFGSAQFQLENYTTSLTPGSPDKNVQAARGYNRNPIVYVHGWTGSVSDLNPYPATLRGAGYAPFYADLETTPAFTPPLAANALFVADAVARAKKETGQGKVIIMGHSMGGLVSRAYIETNLYQGDVSQFFSFGSPHLGIPLVSHIGCLPNQPGVCDMTIPGMALFNITHWKRHGVDYHEIGGDAPLWTTKELFCFKLFKKKRCVSIPWPDHSFRSTFGWVMGNVIQGPDDGFVGTCSAIGQPGAGIDRFVTQEVHAPNMGDREYFHWENNGISQQSYNNCVRRVLVDRSASTCGTRSLPAWGCVLSFGLTASSFAQGAAPSSSLSIPAAAPIVAQRAAPQSGLIAPGQTVSRDVIVEGGGVTFSANIADGSATLYVVDPTGQMIDPAYVASITGGSPDDPDAEVTTDVPNEAVVYRNEGGTAQYYFPNARPGVWHVVLSGNADVPAAGSAFSSEVSFDSSFLTSFSVGSPFLTPGQPASFTLQLPAVASAAVNMSVTLHDGTVVPLAPQLASSDTYTATFTVPSNSGYARVSWSVTGTYRSGVAFERGGIEDVQIASTDLTWGGVQAESTPPRPNDPTLLQSLVLSAQVSSAYTGAAFVSADLAASGGTIVARLSQPLTLTTGSNSVSLAFSGDDIYAAGIDGPYKLTNVKLLDTRGAALLGATATNSYDTGAYSFLQFAPARGLPTVTTTGPYSAYPGDCVQVDATAVDPEGDALSFAWDLDGDGSFEYSGQTAHYAAPSVTQAFSQKIVVRVADSTGSSATAETFIDVSPNREDNLSLLGTPSASSTFAGYSPWYVNDGDTSTALDPGQGWRNGGTESSDASAPDGPGELPAWLDLDFGDPKTVTRITVYTSDALPIRDYDVAVWDGAGWNVVDRVRGNTASMRKHQFAPTLGSKVRITGLQGPAAQPDYVQVNELEVYGH